MTDNLTQVDFQAIADLENVLCILDLERKKKTSSLPEETIAFVEHVLDKHGPIFIQQKDDLKAFAQSARDVLTELLADQPFRNFVGIPEHAYLEAVPSRAMSGQETKAAFEATKGLVNKIVNHFELLNETQKNADEDCKKDKKKTS